jgi:hypothetical protein
LSLWGFLYLRGVRKVEGAKALETEPSTRDDHSILEYCAQLLFPTTFV